MSESPKAETSIDGDAQGPVLSGSFSGPVTTDDRSQTQSVTVNVQGAIDLNIPEPPLREQIKSMWKMMLLDQGERRERLQIADARHEETQEHRESVNAQLDMLTIKSYDTADAIQDVVKEVKEVKVRVSRLEILNIILGALACISIGAIVVWLVIR